MNLVKYQKLVLTGIFCLSMFISMHSASEAAKNADYGDEIQNSKSISLQAEFYDAKYASNQILSIIGHKNPDSDTVFSAIAYSELKNKLGIPAEALVYGNVNEETQFAIDYFNIEPPLKINTVAGKRLVLVDHATYKQAAEGIKEAEIIEIVDHHQFGDIIPKNVISMRFMPLGSVNTIIYQMYLENKIKPSYQSAGAMLTGILSDTNNLRNNATIYDINSVEKLQKIAKIKNRETFYKEMVKAAASYTGKTDKEILYEDSKEYVFNGYKVFITCVNAPTEAAINDVAKRMLKVMPEAYKEKSVDMMFARVKHDGTDRSAIVCYGPNANSVTEGAYGQAVDNIIVVNKVLMRKKDLVPDLSDQINRLTPKN